MEEHRREIGTSLLIYRIHIVMYVLMIGYFAQLTWVSSGRIYGMSIATLCVCIVMLILESVVMREHGVLRKNAHFHNLQTIYKITQILIGLSIYVWFPMSLSYGIGVVISIMYMMEFLYGLEFDDFMNRTVFYLVCIVVMLLYSLGATLVTSDVSLQEQFRKVIIVGVIGTLVIMLGEVLSRIWNYFDGMILSQHRVMDRLNDANAELQEHQEKISKVNEILAFQKFQLQRANDRINAAHEEMIVQNEIANVISSSLNMQKLIRSACDLILKQLEMDMVLILVEPEEKRENDIHEPQRTIYVTSKMGKSFERRLEKEILAGNADAVLRTRSAFVANQGEVQKIAGDVGDRLGSVIIVPMMKNRKRLGNLVVAKCLKDAFVDNREFYETIAGQICIGISNSRLYEQMTNMAIRDGLTGIYNRRYLTEMLHEQLKDAIQKKKPVSLALFDIDKFKMVNDTFGHLFGDTVIKYVARLLQICAENNGGMAGRYGGEEFVLVFPEKSIEETYAIVKELHTEIKSNELEHEGKTLIVKVSCGIASYPETCQNPSDVLTRADWAMYHSKRNGRDQITIDNDSITAIM